ncbi:UMF1 family MFS transporter [Nitrosospira sp. Nsp5]|uniref:MFS transporter, UMF1 family n=1 Tax=Nitrosospira multiformis TaxID=1231 RepID=A0ABY0T6V0_9PROT|nr:MULTISPECIES: MFS transporter [Nitrosospira]PTR06628.1 UMF1 family MFS transporter [Nitrosospira sp. Nsp5]SDQ35923.1 MFS transporter, UMF1 family [Nitrosospira multiformis]
MPLEDQSSHLAAGVSRREVWSWAMFDFANSGYTTVVITAIFNAYFVGVVTGNQEWGTFAWTVALAVSYALIMLTGPALGAYADAYAAKKRLLLLTTMGCVVFTAMLSLVGPGDLWLAVVLIILTNFFFGCGENLIAAFLPELAQGEALGKVSGWGWSLGYIGGLVSLGCSLAYVTWAQGEGMQAAQFVPITMLITAGLFAISSVPTFLYLKERAQPQAHLAGRSVVREAFSRLGETFSHVRDYRDLGRFLACLVFYQAGIQTVITLAAIYAQQAMGFSTSDTMLLVLVVNITAAAGAFAFGSLQDRMGHIPTIALTLIGWIIMVLVAWMADSSAMFWLAANIAGLCLGASQSAGRALVGYFSPGPRRAEFFGLWGLAVKLSSILGPVTYGLVSWISSGDHRLAMLITGIYFIIGLIILMGVDVKRGRRAALQGETAPER